jgi:hypothetical protein
VSQANQIVQAGYSIGPGEQWTDEATTWPVIMVARPAEPDHMYLTHQHPERESITAVHLCCARCEHRPSVFCLSPDSEGDGYQVTAADMLAGILAHIRRSHDT